MHQRIHIHVSSHTIQISPYASETGVPLDQKIQVSFFGRSHSQVARLHCLFEVTRVTDGCHMDGSTQFDTQSQTATFTPLQPWDYKTKYQVTVYDAAFHRTDEQEGCCYMYVTCCNIS